MLTHRSLPAAVFLICLAGRVASQLDYSELEALGVSCPERDKCEGQAWQARTYMERNCECDAACHSYGDCCIDAGPARSSRLVQRTDKVCMNYGVGNHTGVYVVAHCSSGWTGSQTVKEKCEGPTDFSDPMVAAPVTSIAQSVTYRNLFCAECNYANMQSLKTFQFQLACDGLDDMNEAQIIGDLFYDQQRAKWGVNRTDDEGDSTSFAECHIGFQVPESVNTSVRFCRPSLVSSCAPDWKRPSVEAKCGGYTAAVYDDVTAYRNPHCAICHRKSVADLTCKTSMPLDALMGTRKRPMTLVMLLDTNRDKPLGGDGSSKGWPSMDGLIAFPECNAGEKYDPFFKVCRRLVCALPGYRIVKQRCARDGS